MREPSVEAAARLFDHAPLPAEVHQKINDVRFAFVDFRDQLLQLCPDDPELTLALHNLMYAKDHAVRAVIAQSQS